MTKFLLNEFPTELLVLIYAYFGPFELGTLCQVSRRLRALATEDSFWTPFCSALFSHIPAFPTSQDEKSSPVRSPLSCFLSVGSGFHCSSLGGSTTPHCCWKTVASVVSRLIVVDPARAERARKFDSFLRKVFRAKRRPESDGSPFSTCPIWDNLARALQQSSDKDAATVLLFPGKYKELPKGSTFLVLDRDWELVGASRLASDAQVHVPVKFSGSFQKVRNVEFLQSVQCLTRACFENCIFRAGVSLVSGLDHILFCCKVTGSRKNGITVHSNASAVIEHCEVSDNHLTGVEVHSSTSTKVVGNSIHGNSTAVVVSKEAFAVVCKNEIYSHRMPSVVIKGRANATVLENKIYGGKLGLLVRDTATCLFARNDCTGLSYCAVFLQGFTTASVLYNTITGGRRGVVVVAPSGRPLIEGNTIRESVRCAMCIKNSSTPSVLRNTIQHCRWGITIQSEAHADIIENDISHCNKPAICLRAQSRVEVKANSIHHNSSCGVLVLEEARAVVSGNEFFENQQWAVSVRSSFPAASALTSNHIHNQRRGIEGDLMTIAMNNLDCWGQATRATQLKHQHRSHRHHSKQENDDCLKNKKAVENGDSFEEDEELVELDSGSTTLSGTGSVLPVEGECSSWR